MNTPDWYEFVMSVNLVVGLFSGVFFLASWSWWHVRYRDRDRRHWGWGRVDALLWVAVLTGFWAWTAVSVAEAHGWPYPGRGHEVVVAVLATLSSVALASRSLWWMHELIESHQMRPED